MRIAAYQSRVWDQHPQVQLKSFCGQHAAWPSLGFMSWEADGAK